MPEVLGQWPQGGGRHGDPVATASNFTIDGCRPRDKACIRRIEKILYARVKGKTITISHGKSTVNGIIKVTAGSLGMAASGFSFGACVVYGGEIDIGLHCVIGPGAVFQASVALAGSGIAELFE